MCETCGCAVQHHDHHPHDHAHHHGDDDRHALLSQNDRLASSNRRLFQERCVAVVNVVSSPGAGKTALLEKTMRALAKEFRVGAIVGDLATDRDAARLRASGCPAMQITTGSACHLDAHMIHHALDEMNLDALDLLIIENVGNLVCPAAFDLGEDLFIVLLSTTEGEDKPLKYPVIFFKADAVVVNKIDLASAAEFNRAQALENITKAAPKARIFETSARTGEGLDPWLDYLRKIIAAKKLARA